MAIWWDDRHGIAIVVGIIALGWVSWYGRRGMVAVGWSPCNDCRGRLPCAVGCSAWDGWRGMVGVGWSAWAGRRRGMVAVGWSPDVDFFGVTYI